MMDVSEGFKADNYKPIRRDKSARKSVRWAPGTNFDTSGYAVSRRKKARPPQFEDVLRRQDAMKDAVVTLHRVCGQDFHQFVIASADGTVDFIRPSPCVPDSPETLLPLREFMDGLDSEMPAMTPRPPIDSPLVSPIFSTFISPLTSPPMSPLGLSLIEPIVSPIILPLSAPHGSVVIPDTNALALGSRSVLDIWRFISKKKAFIQPIEKPSMNEPGEFASNTTSIVGN